MRIPVGAFRPLAMGEPPGDPELGGWRPLRLLPVSLRPKVPTPQAGAESVRFERWLMASVAQVALRVRELAIKRAVGAVALRLSEGGR